MRHTRRTFAIFVLLIGASQANRPAAGQCTPYAPPTVCPTWSSISCPDDVTGDFCDAEPWFFGSYGPGATLDGDQLKVDQNCDGDVTDPQFPEYHRRLSIPRP